MHLNLPKAGAFKVPLQGAKFTILLGFHWHSLEGAGTEKRRFFLYGFY